MSDVPEAIQGIIEFSREQAANGLCSVLVLKIIHSTDQAVRISDERTAIDEIGQEQIYCPLQGNMIKRPVTHGGEFVSIKSDEPDTHRIGFLHYKSERVLPLWKLVEDRNECSKAIFLPALDKEVELDFSTVVTRDDETSPHSSDELISSEPRTNADILKLLLATLSDDDVCKQAARLADAIQLKELLEYYELDVKKQPTPLTFADRPTEPLARRVHQFIRWQQLKKTKDPIIFTKDYDEHAQGVVTLRQNESQQPILDVEVRHSNLGKNGRTGMHGSLLLRDEVWYSVDDLTGDNSANLIEPGPTDGLQELARDVMDVKEVVVNETLQTAIQELAENSVHYGEFNSGVYRLLDLFREKYGEDQIFDLGKIDLRHLQVFSPHEQFGNQLLPSIRNIKATILAPENADTFSNARDLYECYVAGGYQAYFLSERPIRCVAESVRNAFHCSQEATDCYVRNTTYAFSRGFELSGCIVENGSTAFENAMQLQNCHAKYITDAFTNVHDKVQSCTTEYCKSSFTLTPADTIRDCEVINPRSFFRHNRIFTRPLDSLFGSFMYIASRNNNHVRGRFVNLPRFTGRYRREIKALKASSAISQAD